MSRTRTFVAVPVPAAIVANVEEVLARLSRGVEGVKWVAPKNLHYTLNFLGEVEDTNLHEICTSVAAAAAEYAPFDMAVRGVGAFPSAERPRTVWIGAGAGSEHLTSVQASLERVLGKLGFPRETRKFVPHVTLGRIRRGNRTLARLTEHLSEQATVELGTMYVEEIVVFASELQPEGPHYQVLGRGPLGCP